MRKIENGPAFSKNCKVFTLQGVVQIVGESFNRSDCYPFLSQNYLLIYSRAKRPGRAAEAMYVAIISCRYCTLILKHWIIPIRGMISDAVAMQPSQRDSAAQRSTAERRRFTEASKKPPEPR
jgi:hypothetical protein